MLSTNLSSRFDISNALMHNLTHRQQEYFLGGRKTLELPKRVHFDSASFQIWFRPKEPADLSFEIGVLNKASVWTAV